MIQLWSKALMINNSVYKKDEVIFESATPGTYNVELLASGQYEVYCIGGGAGGLYCFYRRSLGAEYTSHVVVAGGSGSGFIGIIKMEKGIVSCVVGEGGNIRTTTNTNNMVYGNPGNNSEIKGYVVAYGCPASRGAASAVPSYASAAASKPYIEANVINEILNSPGNMGDAGTGSSGYYNGGTSVYEGYGTGGDSSRLSQSAGTAGYVKIVYKGK